jgi:hypothetical protein
LREVVKREKGDFSRVVRLKRCQALIAYGDGARHLSLYFPLSTLQIAVK